MKKMINKSIILPAAVLCLGLVSCNDYLDELPDNRMELKTPEEVSNLLVSAYPSAHPAYLLEMYSDNSDCIDNTAWPEAGRFQRQAFWWNDITEIGDDESPQVLWNTYYSAIAATNAAIDYIEKQNAEEQESYSSQLGEALVCRAYSAFMLSTIFCEAYDKTTAAQKLGIPYPEKTETVVGTKSERGTLEDVYKKIDADLQRGLPLITNNYTVPKYHFTPNAAYAFAARFYLYYQDYDKAIDYATRVLGDTPGDKLRDWKALGELSSDGQIMPERYVNSEEPANLLLAAVYSQWGAINGPYSYGARYAHGKVISETETLQSTGPWGSSEYFVKYGFVWYNTNLSKYMHRKIPYEFEYLDLQAGTGFAHSIYSVFNTDMLLMERAEAYALKGDYDKALADINTELLAYHEKGVQLTLDQIKAFYGSIDYYTPSAPTPKKEFHTHFAIEKETQEPLLQCILHLRRIMTIHEGLRMQDVKRYGIVIYRRTLNSSDELLSVSDTMDENDPRRAIQLPQDVISSGLEANPRNK